jgi:IclR family acetate operon transcriptional repressor
MQILEQCSGTMFQKIVNGNMSQLIDRTLDILELHAGNPEGYQLSETAASLDLAKSATHRLLTQLVQRGYLEQELITQRYRLTLRLVVLGFRHLTNSGLTDVCQPELDKMANKTGELVRLTVVERGSLIWAAQAQGARHGLRYDGNYGRSVNLTATATGKCWLATLDDNRIRHMIADQGFGDPNEVGPDALRDIDLIMQEIENTRRQGYGIAYEEGELGMCAVAAAIPGSTTEAAHVGTISMAAPTVRMLLKKLHGWAPEIVAIATHISGLWPIRVYQPDAQGQMRA